MAQLFGTTIAAIATAIVPAQGSVGIVRVSGSAALPIAQALFQAPGNQPWESHRILYGYVRHPSTQHLIDEALLLIMQAPRSYTREDIVEFHCHGGMIVVQQILQLCIAQGARLAEPGEFTLRAFLNGRLDLTQAESIADLVGARSPQAAQLALAGLQGKLTQPIHDLRETCLDILAEVEARIDFEDDLPPLDEIAITARLHTALETVGKILATADRGELMRTGLKVAIVGRPNVGKSSLLNAWSRCDRAIVTDLPGTTRDVVESHLVVGGIPIQVLDTAGIRDTDDHVEKIGVERSRAAAQTADLILLTLDASVGWTAADQAVYEQVKEKSLLLVRNKIDLLNEPSTSHGEPESQSGSAHQSTVNGQQSTEPPLPLHPTVSTAAALNQGIDALEVAILDTVQQGALQAANLDLAINQRQAAGLIEAQQALQRVQETIANELPLDFWSIDLRTAVYALGQILGEEVTESVLEKIFSRFCIGK